MLKIFTKGMAIALSILLIAGTGLSAEAKYVRGWGKARQLFLKGVMTDPRQPKSIRGGLRNQVNRWQRSGKTGLPRFKNPKGYDIGHHPMHRGSVDPQHLRLETSHDNRSQQWR
jgi:hypothetical protein